MSSKPKAMRSDRATRKESDSRDGSPSSRSRSRTPPRKKTQDLQAGSAMALPPELRIAFTPATNTARADVYRAIWSAGGGRKQYGSLSEFKKTLAAAEPWTLSLTHPSSQSSSMNIPIPLDVDTVRHSMVESVDLLLQENLQKLVAGVSAHQQAQIQAANAKLEECQTLLQRLEQMKQDMKQAGKLPDQLKTPAKDTEKVAPESAANIKLMDAKTETVLRLNVGGKCFETTQETMLRRDADHSIFPHLFASKHFNCQPSLDSKGIPTHFLDRDPITFEHVLAYMRDGPGAVHPIRNPQLRANLLRDADYFHLPGLSQALYSGNDAYEHALTATDRVIRESEKDWKTYKLLGLEDMHKQLQKFRKEMAPTYPLLSQLNSPHKEQMPSAGMEFVKDSKELEMQWREFSLGLLDGMDWTGVVVAGGAALATTLAARVPSDEQLKYVFPPHLGHESLVRNFYLYYYHGGQYVNENEMLHSEVKSVNAGLVAQLAKAGLYRSPFCGIDIDLFLYARTPVEAVGKLVHVWGTIDRNIRLQKIDERPQIVMRSPHAFTFLTGWPFRNVQVILRIYANPTEIITGFDLDSCCVALVPRQRADNSKMADSKDADANPKLSDVKIAIPTHTDIKAPNPTVDWGVMGTERFVRACARGYNMVDPKLRSTTYEARLLKYFARGFDVAIPGLDLARLRNDLWIQSASKRDGLARLLTMFMKQCANGSLPKNGSVPQPKQLKHFQTRGTGEWYGLTPAAIPPIRYAPYQSIGDQLKKHFRTLGTMQQEATKRYLQGMTKTLDREAFLVHYAVNHTMRPLLDLHHDLPKTQMKEKEWDMASVVARLTEKCNPVDVYPTDISPPKSTICMLPRFVEFMTRNPGQQNNSIFPLSADWFADAYAC